VNAVSAPLSVAALRPGEEAEWERFLTSSANGLLFHDLNFLAYHPANRFRFRHLVVRRGEAIVALVPGGLAGPDPAPVFTSPLGASVGGPVVAPKLPLSAFIELVEALQRYARAQGWAGIEMTLAPHAYFSPPSDTLAFALFSCGFTLQQRWLCHMLPLEPAGADRYRTLFRDTAANLVRAGRRRGIRTVEGGIERLDAFLSVFNDTYTRHGAVPTHSPNEIADLLCRLPNRVRLYLAMLADVPVAGLMVMLLSSRVAYSFYICRSTAHAREGGNLIAFAGLIDRLADQGYRWLDMGPSARRGSAPKGVAFFKEGLGAAGYSRDRWGWSARAEADGESSG
jgi:Acetyltransferase (GNAT) domain